MKQQITLYPDQYPTSLKKMPAATMEEINKDPKLHTKNYLFISDDLHHQMESREENPKGGLLCQDCHTSVDIHGDGNIHGTTMGQVEIECADCHGRPDKYAWELPLGFMDEYGRKSPERCRLVIAGITRNLWIPGSLI